MEAGSIRWRTDELLAQAEWLGALARKLVDDASRADDVVQDTWMAALRRPPERGRALRPWLARVARNVARMQRRSDAARAAREVARAASDESTSPDELAARLEGQRLLVDALARLAEPYRSTILLAYFEHHGSDEIARRQGIAAGTVRWRIKVGVDALRDDLDRRHGGDRRVWSLALAPLVRLEPQVTAGATTAALPLQGVVIVSTLMKVGAAAAALALVWFGLSLAGVVPPIFGSAAEAKPVAVTLRPLVETRAPATEPGAIDERAEAPASSANPTEAVRASEATTVDARFVDVEGRALRGVAFTAREGVAPHAVSALSDADGRAQVRIELDEQEGTLFFTAKALGRATWTNSAHAVRSDTVQLGDIVLPPGGNIAGRIVDGEGQPLAAAVVGLFEGRVPRSEDQVRRRLPFNPSRSHRTTSDGDGAFVVEGAPVGYVHLGASARGWLTTFSAPIEVAAGQESSGVEIVLERVPSGELISGTVVDPSGRPVAEARVSYHFGAQAGVTSDSVFADEDGTFVIVLMRQLPHTLDAFDNEGVFRGAHADAVEPGTRDLVLRLRELPHVDVVVRSTDGAPIERFSATAYDPEGAPSGAFSGPGPHSGGRVELAPSTARFVVSVDAPGFELARQGPFTDDAPTELAFALAPAPSVRGRVLAGGAPIAGATVAAYMRTPGRHERDGFRIDRDPAQVASAESDASGAFALTLRGSGDFVLRATAEGFAASELALGRYAPTADRTGVDFALTRGGSIEGRVVAPAGRDPVGTVVAFSRGDGHAFSVRAGADGSYRADRLAAGHWEVRKLEYEISATSHASRSWPRDGWDSIPWNCEVVDGAVTRFDLVLDAPKSPAVVEGRVSVDGSAPGAWTAALVLGELGQGRVDLTPVTLSPDGSFALSASNTGRAQVILTAIGGTLDGLRIVAPLTLAAGANRWSLDLRTAHVALANVPAAIDAARSLGVVWLGEAGVFGLRPLAQAGDVELAMPAGRIKVWRFDESVAPNDPWSWKALVEGEVRAGTTAALRVP